MGEAMTTAGPISHERLLEFCLTLLATNGVDRSQAQEVAENLVWSELVGRENFGLIRLPVYLDRVAQGGLKCPCTPVFEDKSPNISILDADNGFGQYAGKLAMQKAVLMARESGTGTVGVRRSNFFGTGAFFVNHAAHEGMISLVMSNSFPKVVAHGGLKPVFGTNPLAFGAPRENGESLMFDMATSALAGSTVREHIAKDLPLPEGMAIDKKGEAITDPARVKEGSLQPVAGAKGYGLALLVEIFAGVLTGAGISGGVASMYNDLSKPGDNGHFVIAIDISRFMAIKEFYMRLEGLIATIKASQPQGEVLLPGEIRWRQYRKNKKDGIRLGPVTRQAVEKICDQQSLAVPWQAAMSRA